MIVRVMGRWSELSLVSVHHCMLDKISDVASPISGAVSDPLAILVGRSSLRIPMFRCWTE